MPSTILSWITHSLTIFMHHVRNKASIVFGTAPKTRISSQIPVSETKNNETPPSQCWWSSHVCWLMITLERASLWKGGHSTLEVVQKVDESWTSPSSLAQITCSGETSSSSSGLAQIHSAEWRIPIWSWINCNAFVFLTNHGNLCLQYLKLI